MRRLPPPYLNGIILLLLTAVATAVSFHKEAAWIQSRFEQTARLRQQAIFKAFNDKLLVIESMQSVFQALNAVPRPEFGNMADPFQESQPGIDAYRWIAAISGAGPRLQDFARGISRLFPEFRAWERAPSGELVPAQQRPMHYLVMPLPDGATDPYAGFDLASRVETADAIEKAIEYGSVRLSAQLDVILVRDPGNRRVIAIAPVFSKAMQGKGELLGLIAGMFNVPVVIHSALEQLEPTHIRLQVADRGDGATSNVLYQSTADHDESGLGIYQPLQPESYVASMSLGGRQWTLRVDPEPHFVAELGISSTLVTLLCGLAVSLVVPAYLAFYTRKEARLAESQALLREAQMQLLHSQKLEVIGEMTSGIAHDFSNVLQGVLAQADLAAAYAASGDRERLNAALASIPQAVDMATGLVSKLSGFSRTKRRTPTSDLQEVLQGTAVLLKPVLGSSIQLQIRTHGSCWSAVDRTDFEQVVLNLCINARDAIRVQDLHGGSVAINLEERDVKSAMCSSCGVEFSGRFVMLTVRDNGGGIPSATMQRMFDPFYTTKPEGKGTGLGLSIVHSVVHHAAGHLYVESREGQGTTFAICLPTSGTGS